MMTCSQPWIWNSSNPARFASSDMLVSECTSLSRTSRAMLPLLSCTQKWGCAWLSAISRQLVSALHFLGLSPKRVYFGQWCWVGFTLWPSSWMPYCGMSQQRDSWKQAVGSMSHEHWHDSAGARLHPARQVPSCC